MKIAAIIWDYDGTLVDSSRKNLAVTKQLLPDIINNFTTRPLPEALTSIEKYRKAIHVNNDWKKLYCEGFGLTLEETNLAGSYWSRYQKQNETPVEPLPGICELISGLPRLPQAICSQNCGTEIKSLLANNEIASFFDLIIGYEDAPHIKAKPHPERLLYCLEQLNVKDGHILYIGDHIEDMWFVRNTKKTLSELGRNELKLMAIAACYTGAEPKEWDTKPDYIANSVADLKQLLDYLLL